jgi:hypothetical protein
MHCRGVRCLAPKPSMPCVQSLIGGTSDGEKIHLGGSSPFADNFADTDGEGGGRAFWAKWRFLGIFTD